MNKLPNDEIAQACKTIIIRTILVCLTAKEALLCTEQGLLQYVDNLAVISRLLLYVRAYGMPYNRKETPTGSEEFVLTK